MKPNHPPLVRVALRQRPARLLREAPPVRRLLTTLLMGLGWSLVAQAAPPSKPSAPAPAASAPAATDVPDAAAVANSALNAPLFYQLLIGEIEARAGRPDAAFELMLDAARRQPDEGLYRRAVELAIQERSADHALKACKAWRGAFPQSVEALRTHVQLLLVMNQADELEPALLALLKLLPAEERLATIASLPRHLAGLKDKPRSLAVAERVLTPFFNEPATRTVARVSLARMALLADLPDQALTLLQRAHTDDPRHPAPALLALELPDQPAATELVQRYLQAPDAAPEVRLAYARQLEKRQLVAEAERQLRLVVQADPGNASAWLALGMLQVDLRESRAAIEALNNFIQRQTSRPQPATGTAGQEDEGERALRALDLARQLLAQAHEQLGELPQAQRWLDEIDPTRADLSVLTQRATLLARTQRLPEALALVREAPASDNPDAHARLLAEAKVLREARQWQPLYDLLLAEMRRTPEDSELVYELAMVAERLRRYDDMEALLRQVMRLKPDDAHAYNALGYSLADRSVRLDEARALIEHAVRLRPDDAFITDSLGWLAFRQGRSEEALSLLRRAMAARPHAEVAAHLGEVLWASGQKEEARRVWREGQAREADNEALQDVLKRLGVKL